MCATNHSQVEFEVEESFQLEGPDGSLLSPAVAAATAATAQRQQQRHFFTFESDFVRGTDPEWQVRCALLSNGTNQCMVFHGVAWMLDTNWYTFIYTCTGHQHQRRHPQPLAVLPAHDVRSRRLPLLPLLLLGPARALTKRMCT
jgi:hypothetical protein